MSLAQRVGQLIMVDCPSSGVAAATSTAIRRHFVGSVILDGNSTLGVRRTHAITGRLQRLAPVGTKLFISTDQEGGLVQRMRGPGFSTIPSAVVQGTWSPARVRSFAHKWGTELRDAGINVDLAPVLDTVPPGTVSNPPIGDLDREYGRTPRAVRAHGVAAAQGLADAGIAATVKHFPGLGRVTGNTDTTSGVTDTRTVRHDAYLGPFAAAVKQHVPFVMVSTAIYSRIAPGTPAVFSPTVVTGMLRHDLGFHGVIITDDVGIATQVSGYSPAQRAVRFIGAGGTIVLTVDPHVVPAMTSALIARARHSAAFKRKIDAAALVVLRAKRARGLLG
jgi:beta-N-acetylhexosaminidase